MKLNSPEEHWCGMPEYEQEKQRPYAAVNVRFETQKDLEDFCELTGLVLTPKSKSAWFPEAAKKDTGMKRWK